MFHTTQAVIDTSQCKTRPQASCLQLLCVQVMPADVEFIRKHSSGYICVGMEGSTLDRLQLPLMVIAAVLKPVLCRHASSKHRPISCESCSKP